MFWFTPNNPNVLFGDNRQLSTHLCDGRSLTISPDIMLDFRSLPFSDGSFSLVVFDPPHLLRAGTNSWVAQKYGRLNTHWQSDIKKGFTECFRVLKKDGVLIFKWNETQIKLSEILSLTEVKPLFGHKVGKQAKTHWLCFMK
jgi:23S rRNA G2069 N7-methylase RlmK/C1962 C5-methylase RlmI